MTEVSPSFSVITLSITELNSPGKTPRLRKWIKTLDPTVCYLQESLWIQRPNRLKVKVLKKIFSANNNQKRAGVAILISDKIID